MRYGVQIPGVGTLQVAFSVPPLAVEVNVQPALVIVIPVEELFTPAAMLADGTAVRVEA